MDRLSVAVYLQGVIPYTEAIEVAGGHYDRECYEYVDVESIAMAFDVAAGETFAKREIYSSIYFRYISDYLSKELKKISAAHTSTRWVEENGTWRKETPTGRLRTCWRRSSTATGGRAEAPTPTTSR